MITKNTTKWILIIGSIVFGLAIIPSLLLVMFSPMLFDSPEASNNNITWSIFIAILSFPFVTFASIVALWIFYAKKKLRAALICLLFPLINILAIILSFILLEIYCNGAFSC